MVFRFLEGRIRKDTHIFIITSRGRNDAHGSMATSFHTLDCIHLAFTRLSWKLWRQHWEFALYHTIHYSPRLLYCLVYFCPVLQCWCHFPSLHLIKTMPWGFHGSADISLGREGVKSGHSTPKSRFRDISAPLMKTELINPDKMWPDRCQDPVWRNTTLRTAETRGRHKDEASVEGFLLRIINGITRSLIISCPVLQGSI